ncbi:hypothetical protein Dsin_001965 [Dipteronia sinensis]|uniref:adenylate kinase n=1 Tax=Dipteronia sinensis TaxID=43782 RepID=A0AAE0B6D1_9ROSI|nr:hypothetical protein Dsin_001965 [Dipteronia sinensis]
MAVPTASSVNINMNVTARPSSSASSNNPKIHLLSAQLSSASTTCALSLRLDPTLHAGRLRRLPAPPKSATVRVVASAKVYPFKIMISGAPASGKGTQCELIKNKGSENGKRAKEYMEKGQLVPDEIAVMMVKDRLSQPDSQEKGWLLDGYPRSLSQATGLKAYGFEPDLFILLEVSEDILVERVLGRRLDPVTGKIYHLTYFPPETEEIAARLTQRFDDTEEKVKLHLHTHNQNVETVLSLYEDIAIKVKGNAPKEDVFVQVDTALTKLLEQKKSALGSLAALIYKMIT